MARAPRRPRLLLPGPAGNRLRARLLGLTSPRTRLIADPEPQFIGSAPRGRQILEGRYQLAGIYAEGNDPWALERATGGNPAFQEALHGFLWLDDLAAVGGPAAKRLATASTTGWLRRFGRGAGPGWVPQLVARRLLRWLCHWELIAPEREADAARLARVMGRHALFLSHRWPAAPPGLARIEALTALAYGGLALEGLSDLAAPAGAFVAQACAVIGDDGAVPSRNPEELLDILHHLLLAASALTEAGMEPAEAHLSAIARIAPLLRSLRHADGGLARFHGGGRGATGRLDHALAAAGVRDRAPNPAMGYHRLAAGRSTLIADVAPPPQGVHATRAHASTLAFELTVARRPLIVNVGSGLAFGGDWRRAGRATPSHSTLGLDGVSSSRLGAGEALAETPRVFLHADAGPLGLSASHDGWRQSHGLLHSRQLILSRDGRALEGEDWLGPGSEADSATFRQALQATDRQGLRFSLRFHLHPDVEADLDAGGLEVALALRGGDRWTFRHDGTAVMAIQPSVYLDGRRLAPRPTRQIVLSATVADHESRIVWTLAEAQDRPRHIRDLETDELLADA
ncbi:heparinase II/III family protein [Plastorhodobacter daqingensis]|uniref:Heparinase II/III family protein n=1 Tax=Plastorhodobacter daqingensis TaxID=1387281 RepID=A0ABW2ULW7_9RHOB